MLQCRRCQSAALLELARLEGADHTVYRCRACGFLFSPPDGAARRNAPAPAAASDANPTVANPTVTDATVSDAPAGVIPAPPPLADTALARRRMQEVAAGRRRRNPYPAPAPSGRSSYR